MTFPVCFSSTAPASLLAAHCLPSIAEAAYAAFDNARRIPAKLAASARMMLRARHFDGIRQLSQKRADEYMLHSHSACPSRRRENSACPVHKQVNNAKTTAERQPHECIAPGRDVFLGSRSAFPEVVTVPYYLSVSPVFKNQSFLREKTMRIYYAAGDCAANLITVTS